MEKESIFYTFFKKMQLIDRKINKNDEGIDVIIPLINTNILFESSLNNFYKEIPINRLIIGDGGCTDNSIEIVKKFPRVEIIDQKHYKSQGICIAELISKVETNYFIYLHSDVHLAEGWYDTMLKHRSEFEFFESDRRGVILYEYHPDLKKIERAYSGSQMGLTKAFDNIWSRIEDGYLQRNEDLIFQDLIIQEGFRYGRIFDTFHYHHLMNRRGEMEPKIESIDIKREEDREWEIKIYSIQAKGIIKYCQPKPHLIKSVNASLRVLHKYSALKKNEFIHWARDENPIWLKHIKVKRSFIDRIKKKIYEKARKVLSGSN